MKSINTPAKTLPEGKVMLSLSLFVLSFFLFATAVNVFRWEAPVAGALWELLMLPSLAGIVILPVYVTIRYRKATAANRRLFNGALLVWGMSLAALTMVISEVGR